ncbi:MAG: YegP family protein [Clostridia bacterium]|nr:YegP family protein [Clostridia bacterium]
MLYASNGEKMLASGGDYASLAGAKSGIATFKRNIGEGKFDIVRTKSGDFFFKLFNANGSLMAISSDYKTRKSCENAMESTKRFAATAEIIEPKKAAAKKAEAKKAEPKKAEPKKDAPKKQPAKK